MIRNSFIILDRISLAKERSIWDMGIKNWGDFLSKEKIQGISSARKSYYNRKLLEAKKALYSFDSSFFADKLSASDSFRLYDFFGDEAVFLDIETSGVRNGSIITVIGLFDGISTRSMVSGINLDLKYLRQELSRYKLIISYNGASFDLPVLRKCYPDILPQIPHWDLRYTCARLGLKDGLKSIEEKLGIRRGNEIVRRLYGGDPYKLWRMFKGSGDDHYLKVLIEYNEEDCINLKSIANKVYDKMVEKINA